MVRSQQAKISKGSVEQSQRQFYTVKGSMCALSNNMLDDMAELTFHTDLLSCWACLLDLKIQKISTMNNYEIQNIYIHATGERVQREQQI